MRAKNFLGTLIPLAEAEAFDRLGNILHPRKQLLKLRVREPSPEGVEFETRNQPRSRAYDLGDHGVINWAIIGDVTGEVSLVVKHDVEERTISPVVVGDARRISAITASISSKSLACRSRSDARAVLPIPTSAIAKASSWCSFSSFAHRWCSAEIEE